MVGFLTYTQNFSANLFKKQTAEKVGLTVGRNHSTFTSITVPSFVCVTVTPSRWTAISVLAAFHTATSGGHWLGFIVNEGFQTVKKNFH